MRLAHSRKCALATVVFLLPTVTLFASNNAISLLGQPNVDFTTYASSTFNTPVTSFSLTGTAAIAYTGLSLPLGQYIPTVTSLVKYCSQSGCSSFYPNINYGTTPLGDMYLAYDEIRGRWIVVGINGQFGVAHQVYYGYSTGGMWTVTQTTLAANYGYSFELPSIAIDSQGRIIIGANLRLTSQSPTDYGYYTIVSSNGGASWTAPAQATTQGYAARVAVDSGGKFLVLSHGFPNNDVNQSPNSVYSSYSFDGVAWTGPSLLMSYQSPIGFSPTLTDLYGQQYRIPFYPYLQVSSTPDSTLR